MGFLEVCQDINKRAETYYLLCRAKNQHAAGQLDEIKEKHNLKRLGGKNGRLQTDTKR